MPSNSERDRIKREEELASMHCTVRLPNPVYETIAHADDGGATVVEDAANTKEIALRGDSA